MNYRELYQAAGGKWKRAARLAVDITKVTLKATFHGFLFLPAAGFWVAALSHDDPASTWLNILQAWKLDPEYWQASIVGMIATAFVSALLQWRQLGETHERAMLRYLKAAQHPKYSSAMPTSHSQRIEPIL